MGRDYSFYAIPQIINHENDLPFCFSYETSEEFPRYDLIELYNGKIPNKIFPKELLEFVDINTPQTFNCCISKKYKEYWCKKCLLFINHSLFDHEYVVDFFNIRHCYSNEIWWSKYCISNFYPSNHSEFSDFYYDVTMKDVDNIEYEFNNPKPNEANNGVDMDAYNESMQVLLFCRKMLNNGYRVIFYKEL